MEADRPLTVTLVAGQVVVPATVRVPLRLAVTSWLRVLWLKLRTSELLVL